MLFETPQLIISKFTLTHALFILDLVNTPTWLKFIGDKKVKNLEDAHQYIINGPMKSYEENGFGLYLVSLKDSKTPIGMCGLINRPNLEDIDIGFAMLPEFSGKGYGFEAASAILAHAKNDLNLNRIIAITSLDNESSQRLLRKIGMKFEQNIKLSGEEEVMLFGIAL